MTMSMASTRARAVQEGELVVMSTLLVPPSGAQGLEQPSLESIHRYQVVAW